MSAEPVKHREQGLSRTAAVMVVGLRNAAGRADLAEEPEPSRSGGFGDVKHVTVWHDGDCPLCRREIAFMRRLDTRGAITFVDASDAATGCPADRDAMLARFHAQEDGVLLSGAAAFAAMWRAIPLLQPLGMVARNRFVLAGLDRVYRIFLRGRPMLQALIRRMERTT